MSSFRLNTVRSAGRIAGFAVLVGSALLGAYALDHGTADEAPGGKVSPRADAAPPPHFKARQKVTQWRAPRLVGVAVFDAEGKPVGQVEDVLMSHAGVAETVVIGVGGFLGVGAKSVAIPFAAMQWRMSERSAAAPAAPADAGRPPRSGVEIAEAAQGHPDEADVTATRDELEQAPAFAYQLGGSAAPDFASLPGDETQVSPYR